MDKTIVCEICGKKLQNLKSRAGHMWLAHHIRVGKTWNLENEIRQLKEKLVIYTRCSKCNNPLKWDLSDDDVRQKLIETINESPKKWYHGSGCPK